MSLLAPSCVAKMVGAVQSLSSGNIYGQLPNEKLRDIPLCLSSNYKA